jgi:F-type H+-transporting ATPase subunit epsilon
MFKIRIITPERVLLEESVDQATLPIVDGEITVLADHEFYIGALKPGEIMCKTGATESSFAVSGGFVEFHRNVLSILADTAERADEIDIVRAEEARRRAEDLAKEKRTADEDYARIAAMLEKELARIRVARKHRTRTGSHRD